MNLQGPMLRAVIETNPSALAQAAALDEERKTSGPRSALHGIPVLLKDNIATIASEGIKRRSIDQIFGTLTSKFLNRHEYYGWFFQFVEIHSSGGRRSRQKTPCSGCDYPRYVLHRIESG